MFTGIVEEVGIVKQALRRKLSIAASKVVEGTIPGDSININGACLTVTEVGKDFFSVEVMPETLRRTNLGLLRPGDRVNLERALALGGRLGGHLVQGHVDAVGKVLSLIPEDEALLVRFAAPPEVMRYIVEKGFIAVDGVSLTVISHDLATFEVSLVSYTRRHTTLGGKQVGDPVNLEADIIAKYVERLREKDREGLTLEFLASHGFA